MRWRIQLLGVALLLAGCQPLTFEAIRADLAAGHGHYIERVPFIPQEEYYCGPASLAMVLRYWGVEADQDQIASELFLESVRGTLNFDLEFYARRRGLHARSFRGTLEGVKAEVRRDHPLIVFLDLGLGPYEIPHFAVLIGYDDRRGVAILHSGTTPNRVVPYAEFLRAWERRQRWTLLISPTS